MEWEKFLYNLVFSESVPYLFDLKDPFLIGFESPLRPNYERAIFDPKKASMTPMVVGLHLLLEARQPDRLAEGRLITSGTRAGAPQTTLPTCTISAKPNQTKPNQTKPTQTFLQIFLAATCQWVSQSVGQ